MPTIGGAGSSLGERAYCEPVSSSPLQAFTSLWWQECGHHQKAGPPLPGLEAQGLSPGPPQSPAEVNPGLELAWAARFYFYHFNSFKASFLQ